MSEQKTAMEIWRERRIEATETGVDGVYFFGDQIIDMHFALERADIALRQMQRQRDEAEYRVLKLKQVIDRMELERAEA